MLWFSTRFICYIWLCLLSLSQPAQAQTVTSTDPILQGLGVSAPRPHYLKPDQAFILQLRQHDHQVQVHFQLADGYYLYRDKLSWQVSAGTLGQPELPAGQWHEDEFFGKTQVYVDQLSFNLPLRSIPAGSELTLHYQGCTQGMCYPPQTRTLSLQAVMASDEPPASDPIRPSTATPASNTWERALADGWASTAGLFFLLGLGLSLTPCMFPMYPILSALILGRQGLSVRRAGLLALSYVQGMALTYTLLGLAIASVGARLQAWLQQPAILILFSVLFLLLAAAMFGLFNLQLPNHWQTRLHQWADRQAAGSLTGVFLMGAVSALVCTPCTTAPLTGALLYVAQTGNHLLGGAALYALSLGMGMPLLLVGTLGNQWLPKRGLWMQRIKILFGFLLLGVPLLLLSRLVAAHWLWLGSLVLSSTALTWLLGSLLPARWHKPAWLMLPVLIALGWPWLPADEAPTLNFAAIHTRAELDARLHEAQQQGQKVLLDLYADWCVACRQFDADTFRDPAVQARLKGYRLLRADVSQPTAEAQALLDSLQVPGLPALFVFDGQLEPITRVDGFLPAAQFLPLLPTPTQCQESGSAC